MNGSFLRVLAFAGTLLSLSLEAAPRSYEDDSHIAIRETRDTVDDLRHEVRNHESEIRTFEEKLNNLQTMMDALRQQLERSSQASKELVKATTADATSKVAGMETTVKGLVGDFKQLKAQANDTVSTLEQCDKRLSKLERNSEVQGKNIATLEGAINTLMEGLQKKTAVVASGDDKSYRVKAGDSLDKIARANNTTVQAIKEVNQLAKDRIVVGQTLKIP